jgi:1-acyl-sn-glycerol-3-phosphate acyltransferase
MVKNFFRRTLRVGLIGVLFASAALDFFRLCLLRKNRELIPRCLWLQKWSRFFLWIIDCRVTWQGTIPARGIMVSNHLSYLDILVYAAISPMVFVSKSEVRSWPIMGWFTRCAGTIYIRRDSKADVLPIAAEMSSVVGAGVVVTVFPEGTSTGADRVLPFRSSLLAPAEQQGWPATPAWINYSLEDGSVADEVCYWRDMTIVPHLLNLLSKKKVDALVVFGSAPAEKLDRKALALELHARVCQLRETHLAGRT